MPLTNAKKQILGAAQAAFTHQTGMKLELVREAQDKFVLILKTLETKLELEPMVIEGGMHGVSAMLVLSRSRQKTTEVIMVTRQLTAEMADRFREYNVRFLDEAGNAYINQPPFYIFIKGNKIPGVTKTPVVGRTFKQTGLRVLYALLCNHGLENQTYRTIAAKTNVALGMVNWVMKELLELGFLLEMGKGRARNVRLIEKEKLLERWVTAYAEQLRPKLVLGRYRGPAGWWQHANLKPEEAQWGGEVAAAKLTNYLKPQEITVYVDKDNPAAVLIPNRLKKDPAGDVELLYRFWRPETIAPNGDMVHPLLVYADLMATGNQRNLETARMIYDQHIVQLIRED